MTEENRSRLKVLDRDIVKFIALIPMFIGHTVAWINMMHLEDSDNAVYKLPMALMILSGISLICPPIMFFFIADGYKYTRDRKKYAKRLLLFALITQPFDWLLFQPIYGFWTSNVIFTLFFGLLAIMAWESGLKLWQRIGLIILCDSATVLIMSDWIVFGVLFILVLHIFRDRPKARAIAYFSLTAVYFLPNLFSIGKVPTVKLLVYVSVMILMFTAAYLCMTVFYSGKKGSHPLFSKWFF